MPKRTAERILVVDDEAPIMKALCQTLTQHGYETSGFSSGKEALAELQPGRFDLLLTDLMMPDLDGIGLLNAAVAIDPDLVGVMITGEGSITSAVAAMNAGALDYILKPFKLSTILPVLARALNIRRLRLENARLEKRMRERAAELELANKELEAFSYSVSHDLRAPLRHINGFAGVLLDEFGAEIPAEARRLLTIIVASGKQMEQLIQDLLTLSKVGRQSVTREPVAMAGLIEEVLRELPENEGNRRVELRLGELPNCHGDLSLLRQVLVNLLANAFKFTRHREMAIIEVGSRQKAGERVYFVRDNGAGFDMQYADKLFGVFQRLHSMEEYEGTGVGLSIVQRIIQRHGGRIWAEGKVDEGATFYFTVPPSPAC